MKTKNKSFKRLFAFLVALVMVTALVPSVIFAAEPTFPDVPADYWAYDYIETLAEKEIIGGYPDGTFGPKNDVTRQQAAKMIAKAAGLKAGVNFTSKFTDIDKVASDMKASVLALEENKVVGGFPDGSFGPTLNIKRSQAAKMIVLAFGIVKGGTEVNFADPVSDATDQSYIDILASNGIVKGYEEDGKTLYKPRNLVTREQLAKMIVEAMELELEIVSVSAINAKTVEVEFNQEVDTSKAVVELLRGTFKQNVTLKWADGKQSVQLIGAGNFPAADYTVKVSGLTEEPLTAELKIEAQKVVSINILSDVAVADKPAVGGTFTDAATTATVGYEVLDQYGVDIAKGMALTVNPAGAAALNGKLTLGASLVAGKKVGDLVPVVLVHDATGVSAVKTLTLSDASTVASVAVKGIYNAKGEEVELTDKTTANSAYLVLDLKDQYGEDYMKAPSATELIITNTNPTVVTLGTIAAGKTVANKDSVYIPIASVLKAGSSDLIFITTADGESVRYTLLVAETTTTDAITVGQPELAIEGEDVKIPLTVLDKEGNLITDRDLLSNSIKGIWVGDTNTKAQKAALEVKDGQVYYNAGSGVVGYQTYMFGTSTLKTGLVTFEVKAAAVPTAVRGFKSPLVLKVNAEETIEWKHVNVEDQYGRTMKTADLEAATDYALKVEEILEADDKAVTVNSANKIKAGVKNGTVVVTLLLTKKGTDHVLKPVANSAVEQTVRVTDGKEYTSFEIAPIGLVEAADNAYGDTADAEEVGPKAFTVNGILNGGKVKLDPAEFTATVSKGSIQEGNKIAVVKADLNKKTGTDTPIDTEVTLRVTIIATGTVLEQKFTVSPDVRSIQEFFFSTEPNVLLATSVSDATLASGKDVSTLASSEVDDDDKYLVLTLHAFDQYGNYSSPAVAFDKITIVPEKAAEVNISGNGTSGAKVALVDGVKEATVTLTLVIDDATEVLTVSVVPTVNVVSS